MSRAVALVLLLALAITACVREVDLNLPPDGAFGPDAAPSDDASDLGPDGVPDAAEDASPGSPDADITPDAA